MAIKFCVKAGKSAVETVELINKAYGSATLTEDRRTTLQMIANDLNIGKETVRRIVSEDLGKRKI